MKIYIEDTTLHPPKIVTFTDYPQFIRYLEEACIRKFNKTRKQRMDDLIALGHGYDDSESVTFVRSMQDVFNIGTIKGHRYVKCDVTVAVKFQSEDYGD